MELSEINILVENWQYSPHIHHIGVDNYQDFRGGEWGVYDNLCIIIKTNLSFPPFIHV